MGQNTRVSGISRVVKMVREFKFGSMDHFMKATGKTTKLTAEVD
jgi:hypothetical protein